MEEPRATILVVDDNEQQRALAHRLLTMAGYRVLTASDIWIGSLVRQARPDVILLDVQLAEFLSGAALVRILKRSPWSRSCRTLLYSALDEDELRRIADQSGADGYICKTRGPRHMLETIQSVLREDEPLRAAVA